MITLRLDIVFFFFLAKSFYKNLYIIYPQYLANCSRRNILFELLPMDGFVRNKTQGLGIFFFCNIWTKYKSNFKKEGKNHKIVKNSGNQDLIRM